MSAIVTYLFGAAALMPHGHCLLWRSDVVALHVAADAVSAAAFLSIPAASWVVLRRRDLGHRWLAGLLALVAGACASTQLLDLVSLWQPVHELQAVAKLASGVSAVATVLLLRRFLPRLATSPSPAALQRKDAALVAEVGRRRAAEAQLQGMRDELERRVRARTRELETSNAILRQSQERLAYLATHDSLTGLPNRQLFHQLLQQEYQRAWRYGHRFALLMADLDGFKRINDRLGHAAGDALLTEIARRLKGAVRASDVVARLGGDEFAIIMGVPADERALATLTARLTQAVARPVAVRQQQVSVGISIGVAMFADDGPDPDLLFERADLALYAVKASGRSGAQCYRPGMWREQRQGMGLALPAIRGQERGSLGLA